MSSSLGSRKVSFSEVSNLGRFSLASTGSLSESQTGLSSRLLSTDEDRFFEAQEGEESDQIVGTGLPSLGAKRLSHAASLTSLDAVLSHYSETSLESSRWVPKSCRLRSFCSLKCWANIGWMFGIFLILVATILSPYTKSVILEKIEKTLSLADSHSEGFRLFVDSTSGPDKIYARIHLFDVLNAGDILKGAKPKLHEIGPYTFEVRNVGVHQLVFLIERWIQLQVLRFNITWEDERNLIRFMQWPRYKFVPEMSQGDMDLEITLPNLPFWSVAGALDRLPIPKAPGINLAYSEKDQLKRAFTRRTVRSHLFGYIDKNLHPISNYPGLLPNLTTIEEAMKTPSSTLYTGKFMKSHQYKLYGDSKFSTNCLFPDTMLPVCIDSKPIWATAEANRVHGSDGSYFEKESISKRKPLTVYNPFLRRAVNLTPVSTTKLETRSRTKSKMKSSLDTVKYNFDPITWRNATEHTKNKDYYQFGPTGLINMTAASYGLKLFISKPHFLDADVNLISNLEGMEAPNRTLHDSVFELHRQTGKAIGRFTFIVYSLTRNIGVPCGMLNRLQVNALMAPVKIDAFHTEMKKLIPNYMPILWMELEEKLSQHHKELFEELDTAIQFLFYATIVGFIISPIALVFACTGSHIHASRRHRIELKKRRSLLYDALLLESGDEREHFHRNFVLREDIFRHPALIKQLIQCFICTILVSLVVTVCAHYRNMPHWMDQSKGHKILEVVGITFFVGFSSSIFSSQVALRVVQVGAYPTVYWPQLVHLESKGEYGTPPRRMVRDPLLLLMLPLVRKRNALLIALNAAFFSCILFACPLILLIFSASFSDVAEYVLLSLGILYIALESTLVCALVWIKIASGEKAPLYYELYANES